MFSINIENATMKNKNYRKVLYTDSKQQLVVMCLGVGESIPLEKHNNGSQFFRVEQGSGVAKTFNTSGKKVIKTMRIKDGMSFIIHACTFHEVKNTGKKPLKLYTIYSPPQHNHGTIQKNAKP